MPAHNNPGTDKPAEQVADARSGDGSQPIPPEAPVSGTASFWTGEPPPPAVDRPTCHVRVPGGFCGRPVRENGKCGLHARADRQAKEREANRARTNKVQTIILIAFGVLVVVAIGWASASKYSLEEARAAQASEASSRASVEASIEATAVRRTSTPRPPQAPQPTQGDVNSGFTLVFNADGTGGVIVQFSCGGMKNTVMGGGTLNCHAPSGATVSVTGVSSSGGVGMQCHIDVNGQAIVSKQGTTSAGGGNLTCSTVVP